MKTCLLLLTTSIALAFAASSPVADNTAKAKELFERYVALEHAFDVAQADLYSDDAKIQNTRTYPDGQKRTITIPAPDFKKLIRSAMPLAKEQAEKTLPNSKKRNDKAGSISRHLRR